MIEDFKNYSLPIGIPVPPEPDLPIQSVLNFVEKHLPEFALENTGKIKNEKGLNQNLVKKLNTYRKDEYPFFFEKEFMEDVSSGKSPTIDIGIISTKDNMEVDCISYFKEQRFFAFEAKILGVSDNSRKKEYIIGNNKPCGGIERFKKCIHAPNLVTAGMIGFVLKEDFKYWHNQINEWIEELKITDSEMKWNKNDKLTLIDDYSSLVSKYFSTHIRNCPENPDIGSIKLYHYWVKLN